VEVESRCAEQLIADWGCCAEQLWKLVEVRQRREGGAAAIGTFQIFEYDVRNDAKLMGRRDEETGNNSEFESSRNRVLQWR
jgi:hypothetical protein